MSRADRRRIRRTLATAGAVQDARASLLARYDTCTPDQRRRIAWYALSLLPGPDRVEVLERHLAGMDVSPDLAGDLAAAISAQYDRAHELPAVRLRALRYDVP